MSEKITVRGYTTDADVELMRMGICPINLRNYRDLVYGYHHPVTITLGHQNEAQPEPEGERRTVYMAASMVDALRRGALISARVTTSQRESYSEPVTLILPSEPQPRTRFCVIEHSGEGDFTVWDNEAGRPAWEVPPNYPGGPEQAAWAERDRLNGLVERGEL